jgi:hypothetical protein
MPQNARKPRLASGANAKKQDDANDRHKRQPESITCQTSTVAILPNESSPSLATSPRWLISRLDTLAELHADAWGSLERLTDSLAECGVAWFDLPGAADLFGSLDKASMLAFTIRRELAEGVDRAVA